jgi:hypothetical protein
VPPAMIVKLEKEKMLDWVGFMDTNFILDISSIAYVTSTFFIFWLMLLMMITVYLLYAKNMDFTWLHKSTCEMPLLLIPFVNFAVGKIGILPLME